MDPKWEFNANQFVDFNNLEDQDNSKADDFFDINMETGERIDENVLGDPMVRDLNKVPDVMEEAEKEEPKEVKLGTPYIVVTSEEEKTRKVPEQSHTTPSGAVPERTSKRPANLVSSWGPRELKAKEKQAKAGVASSSSSGALKTRTSPRVSGSAPKLPPKSDYVVKQQQTVTLSAGGSRPAGTRQMTPRRAALKAKVEATIANVRNSPRLAKLTPKRLGTNISSPRLGRTRTTSNTGSARTPELTKYTSKSSAAAVPRTPDVMRKYRAKLHQGQNIVKQVMDLDAIKNKLAKKSEPVFKRQSSERRSGSGPSMAKPTLTKPVEFNFATSSRVKSNSASKASDAPDFSRMLRSYSKKTGEGGAVGVTQPIPFNLSAGVRKRRHSADPNNKFKSAAEIVQHFQKDTPDRFRSKPRPRPRSVSPGQAQGAKLTIPHTPQLMTRGRSRPVAVLSKEEREAQELEEHKAMMFRAKAVGETVPKFKYGEVERKACTVPEPFQLHASSRIVPRTSEDEEKPQLFTAKPVPKGLMSGPVGIPERKMLPVVEPQSPAFALKNRMHERKPRPEPEVEVQPVVKARPAPHRGVPVVLAPNPRKATLPEPFSFETRDKAMIEKKEEKIRQIIEEEKKAREFHAKPVMKEEAVKMPAIKPLATTKVEPFKLAIEERCEERLAKWQEGVQKELEEQRRQAYFKASDPKVLAKAPFEPKPSEKPLSEVGNFMLHSERRAREREEFDVMLKKREAEMEGAKREQEQRKRREEEEERNRLRKEAVPKAQPIRSYRPLEIRPSEKPLTLPASPNFSSKNTTFKK